MRKILTVVWVVVFFLTGSVAYGQVTPNLASGTKAMLFEFGGLDDLGANNFEGGAGFKYFLSGRDALRIGLQFAKFSATEKANPTAPDTGVDGKDRATTIGLSLALERHLTSTRVSPYIGIGAGYSRTSTEFTDSETGSPPPAQTTFKGGDTTINIFALAGFEFFLTSEVSLAAEYRLGYAKISPKDDEIITGTSTITFENGSASLFDLDSSGLLTLAIYF